GPWAGSRRVWRKAPTERTASLTCTADQLHERLSRACVIDEKLAWSELGQEHCLNFGPRSRHRVCSGQPKFKKLRRAEDDQWPGGCHNRKAARLMERREPH